MSSPSIRSFALDYYRKRGAEIRPLPGDESYEISATTGAPLVVTFADDREAPTAAAVNATSPQWRAILEDLTAEVAVSYRYLAAGPIARPTATLAAVLGTGWTVESARLLGVDNRVALGFTHRVTFDSPALNSCSEVMHDHLWDVIDERRLLAIEPKLYDLPCIMLRPERFPTETTVQGLLGRTLAVVDVVSDARGRDIERELALMLDEAEKRTNQYFDQQMGNVLAREITLGEKLDAAIRRMTDARSPEAGARARTDADSLARQLEHAKAHRAAELATVEAACTHKLLSERERHELTAVTDLVAICHASYDVLTYQCEVVSPEGQSARWTLRYCPVSNDVILPACPRCDQAMQQPAAVATAEGLLWACASCLEHCRGCGAAQADAKLLGSCALCPAGTCPGCVTGCVDCQASTCADHAIGCGTCEAPVCVRCATRCSECDEVLCTGHARFDAAGGRTVCDRHLPAPLPAAGLQRRAATEPTPPWTHPAAPRPALVAPATSALLEAASAAYQAEAEADLATAEATPKAGEWAARAARAQALARALRGRVPAPKSVWGAIERRIPKAAEKPAVAVNLPPAVVMAAATAALGVAESLELDDTYLEEAADYADEPLVVEAAPAPSLRSPSRETLARIFQNDGPDATPEQAALPEGRPAWLTLVEGDEPAPEPAPVLASVISHVSGRALHPSKAEVCPACSGHVAVQEMVDCATCGTPSCLGCASGPTGPCPACEALVAVEADDERLDFVYAQFPKLARSRRWEVSQLGPYVLAHWSRLGAWGMVVYHTAAKEPVVLTSFAYGRFDTFKQALGGLLTGGK